MYTFARVPRLGVEVHRGITHDGLGKYLSLKIDKAGSSTADIGKILRETRTDVVVFYLPVGSEMATKGYFEPVLEAGCGFINCIPVFIASQPYWQQRFREKNLPIIGDDIKSQGGPTITHRALVKSPPDNAQTIRRANAWRHSSATIPLPSPTMKRPRTHAGRGDT